MKIRTLPITLLISLIPITSHALNCKKALTTSDINECARAEQKIVEAKLNKTYQRVLKGLDQPDNETEKYSEMKQKLIEAQSAWGQFRKADCDAVYARYAGGTIRSVMFIGCMLQHAEQRIEALEAYEQW